METGFGGRPRGARAPRIAIRLFAVVALLISLGLTVSKAHAQPTYTFTVNSLADDSNSHDTTLGDGVCNDALGRCTIRAALEEASSNSYPFGTIFNIQLPAGTIYLTQGQLRVGVFHSNSSLNPNTNNVNITGEGAAQTIINGNQLDRVFDIEGLVNMASLTVTGGMATTGESVSGCENFFNESFACGGGILDNGQLTLTADVITGNTVAATPSSCGGDCPGIGGSIPAPITSTYFYVYARGGGIFNSSYTGLTLRGTNVTNNSVTSTQSPGSCSSTTCNFYAYAQGGGIYNYNSSLVFNGGSITGNTANGSVSSVSCIRTSSCNAYGFGEGAGLYNDEQAQLQLLTISNNTASGSAALGSCLSGTCFAEGSGHGGGMYNSYQESVSTTTISNNQAQGASGKGGGVYENGQDQMYGVTIQQNTAGFQGGGIWNDSALNISNSSVRLNTAGTAGGTFGNVTPYVGVNGQGGGIYNQFSIAALYTSISTNSAYDGGGLYNACTDENQFGLTSPCGVSPDRSNPVNLNHSTVQSNKASHDGGGFYDPNFNVNGTIALYASRVLNNSAGTAGGGAYNRSFIGKSASTIAVNTAPLCPNTYTPCV